jgi:hypothetical protein
VVVSPRPIRKDSQVQAATADSDSDNSAAAADFEVASELVDGAEDFKVRYATIIKGGRYRRCQIQFAFWWWTTSRLSAR